MKQKLSRDLAKPSLRNGVGRYACVLALEGRVLFETAPPFIDPAGVLRISATDESALVGVVRISDPTRIKVEISVGFQAIETYYFARSQISSIDVVTGEGRDVVNLLGNEENNEAPFDLTAVISTAGGPDVIFCGVGSQIIDTGSGDDGILYNGRTDVSMGPGNDEVVFIHLWDGGTIDLGPGNDFVRTDEPGDVDSVPVTILGGEGDDTIDLHEFGEFTKFRFSGGSGLDTIDCGFWQRTNLNLADYPETENVINFRRGVLTGNELDNLLTTGDFNPYSTTLLGGAGNDTIRAQSDHPEFLDGGEGNDLLIAFDDLDLTSPDTVMGGSGNDTIVMNNGDFANAGVDDDLIEVQNSANPSFATVLPSSGSDELVVRSLARARFNDNLALSTLLIEDQARFSARTDGSVVLRTRSLSLAPTAQLDLADNALILDYTGPSPIDSIRAQLQSGRAGGAWNGSGIASSSADDDARFGVGFAESADLFSSFPAVFAGQAVDDSPLLLRYTRNGDADLNGTVDMADFSRLAAQFNVTTNRWSAGDFNYDGVSGFNDFAQLAAGFGQTFSAGQNKSAYLARRTPPGPLPEYWEWEFGYSLNSAL